MCSPQQSIKMVCVYVHVAAPAIAILDASLQLSVFCCIFCTWAHQPGSYSSSIIGRQKYRYEVHRIVFAFSFFCHHFNQSLHFFYLDNLNLSVATQKLCGESLAPFEFCSSIRINHHGQTPYASLLLLVHLDPHYSSTQ